MIQLPILTLALSLLATAGHGQDGRINVLTWGGDFTEAQAAAFARPFQEMTGIRVNLIDSDDPPVPVKAQAESGNVTADLASVGNGDALRLCDEGLAMPIDPAILAPGVDGAPAAQDFLPGALGNCFVGTDIYSTVIAFDRSRIGPVAPSSAADFFDLARFPGRRGLSRTPEFTLELALLADGVPPAQVYPLLSTDRGLERAFAKLDSIRDRIVWWEAGAQPIQLLADGEVAMTLAYNGRIFKAATDEGRAFEILWDGQMYEIEGWIIPRGAPHPQDALAFLVFSTSPERLADAAEQLPYGPPRRSAQALVGTYKDGRTRIAPHLPTAPANMRNALLVDPQFWADHETELRERFAAWLAR
ncbi:MAG TPA: ABC transporter substrate-binding protein [Paracoccus sp. (in: a-proteobacteria)]|nr:ABC transporter substrate-binding protein [Paracoccus sp. (in: a-proteobacteria)]